MISIMAYLAIGLLAGVFSGALGIGGGTILIPIMVFFFQMTQHQAQGTTLAVMLPPVFIFAAWRYYQEGHVHVPMAILMAIGLMIGAWVGAHYVQNIPAMILKRVFGFFLLCVGLKMIFSQ